MRTSLRPPGRTLGIVFGSVALGVGTSRLRAQAFDLSWHAVAGGGGNSTGGGFSCSGTAGQSDAGILTGGGFQWTGGFWAAPVACYANCDGSTVAPVLNVNDFICFQGRFAAGDPYANCDGSTTIPVLNVNDFICFQARFASGCP